MNKEELLDQLAMEILRIAPHTFERSYEIAGQMLERRRKIIDEWASRDAHVEDVESLELTARSDKCLAANEIFTINQLLKCTENDLLKMPNLGRRSLNEIKDRLAERGLKLKGQA
jgi:DNA-directed RNA polymerase alpha subunit